MNFKTLVSIAALITFLCTALATGATEPELKERFKQRLPQLNELKSQGKLGETAAGYVEAVKPEFLQAVKQVADAENADRRELYQIIAKRAGTTPDAVAARNAARNFEKASPGHWLKHADGKWRQK